MKAMPSPWPSPYGNKQRLQDTVPTDTMVLSQQIIVKGIGQMQEEV